MSSSPRLTYADSTRPPPDASNDARAPAPPIPLVPLDANAALREAAARIAQLGGWEYDAITRRVLWSDEVCAIHELPPGTSPTTDEALAHIAPEWRTSIGDLSDACLRYGTPFDEELRIVTASGRKVWVRAVGEPVFGAGGEITGVRGALQDITEKRRAQDDARRLAARLTATLESITDAFYTLDREWRFTYMNAQAERLFGRPRDELMGKVIWDEYPALRGKSGYHELLRAMRENRTVSFEKFHAHTQVWSAVRVYPSEEGLTVCFRDITRERRTQQSLEQSEERFRIIARSTTDTIWDWDIAQNKTWRSDNVQTLFGYAQEDFQGSMNTWANRIHLDDRARVLAHLDAALESADDNWMDEYRFIRKNGSTAYVLDRGFIMRDQDGRATRMVGAVVDLTQRRETEARIREQASLLDKAKDAIVVRGIDNRVRYWNKGAERLYGWTVEEAVGRSVEELLYHDPAIVRDATRRVLETGEWSGEITEHHKDGTALAVEVQWTLMRDENGRPESIFAIKTDISRRKAAERRIAHLAFHDPLTQLPNRQLLLERLERAMAVSARNGAFNALFFIDLDNFKTLNDTLGHTVGDRLLQQVAERLRACVGAADTVARFGGDEYVLLLEALGASLEEASARASAAGELILDSLNQPYQLGEYQHCSTPSIGITLFSDSQNEGADTGTLLMQADLAMYQAKAAGRNAMRFFVPAMQEAAAARMSTEAELRRALRDDEFELHYQPQVDRDGRIAGVEALLRWRHPARGLVAPTEFVPLAEETGLILALGERVMNAACRQLAAWASDPYMAALEVSINVSARQFHHPDFAELVLEALARSGANSRRLKLELTETVLLDHVEDTIGRMQFLKTRGLSFALDDFGTGYSSLTYLKRLPLDVLKIDRSFVQDLLDDRSDAVIARTIVALGCNLGLRVVAEGVENERQRDFLFQVGCDAYQGFLCTQPVPASDISAFVKAWQQGVRGIG
jgi:diguanylate cyclase (GGDEF)-like protein/PAS domain S-box-containing protein